jgi:hypothetical protein
MRLQQSGFSGFGYSPSASTTASGGNTDGPSQATAGKLLLGSVGAALGLSGSTGSVQEIASALSSALSTGLASGQDLAPQLTQTVDNALDQVSQQLQAQGVSASHVAKLIAKFRQDLSDALSSAAAAASAANGGGTSASAGSSANSGSATSVAATPGVGATTTTAGNPVASSLTEFASVRERESLTIQTTDGARVTIRFRAQATGIGVSQTQADGSTSSAAALFESGKFQVEVSGNLSSADLTAINNIVSQVDSLATEFFSGDVQDAFAAAASINSDPSEIAGFSLQMSYSATVYQQASTAVTPPTTNTVPPVVTTPTTTSQASATPGATDTASVPASTTAAAAAPGATATPQQTIANFLQNALSRLSITANGSSTTLSAHWGIKLLAVALPVYAQSQPAATGSQAGTGTSQTSDNSSPGVTQVATQAAHLAAATLVQLVS